MSRVVRSLAAVALLAAALPAAAFVRETTEHANPSRRNLPVVGRRNVPVHVNASGVDQTACSSAVDAENAVTTALARWGNATRTGRSPVHRLHLRAGRRDDARSPSAATA